MGAEERYHLLFNRITDALEELEALNIGRAKNILVRAQQKAEEAYLAEQELKETEGGMSQMSEIMEEYAKEYAKEKVAEADARAEAFMRKAGLSEEQIMEFRRQTAERRSKS